MKKFRLLQKTIPLSLQTVFSLIVFVVGCLFNFQKLLGQWQCAHFDIWIIKFHCVYQNAGYCSIFTTSCIKTALTHISWSLIVSSTWICYWCTDYRLISRTSISVLMIIGWCWYNDHRSWKCVWFPSLIYIKMSTLSLPKQFLKIK
jgi:hypothetical protein